MDNFKEHQPSEEELRGLKREGTIRNIIKDTVALLAKNVPDKDIETLLGKGFADSFGEGRNIQEQLGKWLGACSPSELETIDRRITFYKKEKQDILD
jgi:hypothetical protein